MAEIHRTRRGFLRNLLGASWTSAALLEQSAMRAAAANAQARTTPRQPKLFDIVKVAPGAYAAIAKPAVLTNCNGFIFENARDLLVVDSHSKPSAVTALVAQIRAEVSPKPVRYIVNTHFHWDHTQGASAYRRAYPNIDIISSEATHQLLKENGAARLKESVEQARASVEGYKQKLAAAQSAEDKAWWTRMVADSEAYIREMRDYQPELATTTFSNDLMLHDAAHDLHLSFRGRGHTAGDVVVFCPQKKVIATGDLLHGALPYLGDAWPREWPLTLVAVAQFDFLHAAGGHGPVQPAKKVLYMKRDYLEELAEEVSKGKQRGRTAADLQNAVTPATLKSLSGPYREWLLTVFRAGSRAPGIAPEPALAASVRSNIADMYKALDRT